MSDENRRMNCYNKVLPVCSYECWRLGLALLTVAFVTVWMEVSNINVPPRALPDVRLVQMANILSEMIYWNALFSPICER